MPMPSILQDWVQALGLRHQGTLMTAIRGCDTAPKDDPSKLFVRCYRALVLNPHCGDVSRAASFVEWPGFRAIQDRFHAFRRNMDHYPHHYVMHLMHAIEIVGYKYPISATIGGVNGYAIRIQFESMYRYLCKGMHINPETEAELDARLNADEDSFGREKDDARPDPSEFLGSPPEQRKGPYPGGRARPEYVQTFTRPDEPIPEDIRRGLEALKVQVRTPPPPYGTGADDKHARPAGFLHNPVAPPRDE
jgi:hypothetical protein